MSVDQTKIIDIISKSKDGEIVLTISDHLDWKNLQEHLLLLQEKINTYLTFLESKEKTLLLLLITLDLKLDSQLL